MTRKMADERPLKVLRNATFWEIILAIIRGKDYATAIAKDLGKKQPTVTEQLQVLRKSQLIRPAKREKAQRYELNWEAILRAFYEVVFEALDFVLKFRKHLAPAISHLKINSVQDLEKIIPEELIKSFLKEYSTTVAAFGGKKKAFDELVFSFFCALSNLERQHWNLLCKKFNVSNEKALLIVAEVLEFEIYGIELTALTDCLTIGKRRSV